MPSSSLVTLALALALGSIACAHAEPAPATRTRSATVEHAVRAEVVVVRAFTDASSPDVVGRSSKGDVMLVRADAASRSGASEVTRLGLSDAAKLSNLRGWLDAIERGDATISVYAVVDGASLDADTNVREVLSRRGFDVHTVARESVTGRVKPEALPRVLSLGFVRAVETHHH